MRLRLSPRAKSALSARANRCQACGSRAVLWQFLPMLEHYRYYCQACPETWVVEWKLPPSGLRWEWGLTGYHPSGSTPARLQPHPRIINLFIPPGLYGGSIGNLGTTSGTEPLPCAMRLWLSAHPRLSLWAPLWGLGRDRSIGLGGVMKAYKRKLRLASSWCLVDQ